jgi:hypothetical protein
MHKIYSYVLRFDDGGAPNPYHNLCTLAICKPIIRRNAELDDWVIGTGSSRSKCNDGIVKDFSNHLVYAMKITDIKSMQEYDTHCQKFLPEKIPNWESKVWPEKMGDCIYDYSNNGEKPVLRKSVHGLGNVDHDLNGKRVLMSNDFYYFGENPIAIPEHLMQIIKRNQGHKKILNLDLIKQFEEWIRLGYNRTNTDNVPDPQLRHVFDRNISKDELDACAHASCKDDIPDEEIIS